jgi:hypothetical protein
MVRILVVEDDEEERKDVLLAIEQAEFREPQVAAVSSAIEAKAEVAKAEGEKRSGRDEKRALQVGAKNFISRRLADKNWIELLAEILKTNARPG